MTSHRRYSREITVKRKRHFSEKENGEKKKSCTLIEEDWDEEIRKMEGEWKIMMDEIEKQEDTNNCKHKEKFWFQ